MTTPPLTRLTLTTPIVESFPVPLAVNVRELRETASPLGLLTRTDRTETPAAPGIWVELEGEPGARAMVRAGWVGVTVAVLLAVEVAVDVAVSVAVEVAVSVAVFVAVAVGATSVTVAPLTGAPDTKAGLPLVCPVPEASAFNKMPLV